MSKTIYYCVLKNYKGIFKKKYKGNTHLFFIPLPNDNYLYLGLLGELVEEEGSYACQTIVKLPKRLLKPVLDGEKEHFGERFITLEEIPCESKKLPSDEYEIKLSKKGKFILSTLTLRFDPDYSTSSKKIYIIRGLLNLESQDVDPDKDLKMVAAKQMAFIGNKERFNEILSLR